MAISEPLKSDERNGNTEEEDEKPRTLFVGNVPREVHKREIEEIFGEIGPLKRCYIQYPRDDKRRQREETTVAYVTFALSQDAAKALETLQNSKIGDNKINIKFAKARSEQNRLPHGEEGNRRGFHRNPNFEPLGGEAPKPKEPRPKPVKKKSRLIVRNLSFKVTDEKLREYFQQIGELKDINILKKPNGKLVGCAFVQYQNVFQAAQAIKELNLKPFLGRPIAIDWALPKEKYQTDDEKKKKKADSNEAENDSEQVIEMKEEPESEAEEPNHPLDPYEHLKEEKKDIEEIKEEPSDNKSKLKERRKRKRDDVDDEDDDDDDEEDSESENEKKFSPKKKQQSNDVQEGKTLFLRNLSFDTKEDDLKQFFEKFGPLEYALLCKDKLTEHPKGTGFIKFKAKSAADECLKQYEEDESEFKLNRRQFNVSVALPRGKVESQSTETHKKDEKKSDVKPKSDGRNLYLAREGFIRPGTVAAEGVSASDMNKRATLNKVKKQMLKNLNIIVSPTRLCVHNLPPNYTDQELRKLFKKHGGRGAKVTEARIMRDMNNIQLDGKGKSKGFAFVNFTDHEHALAALRSLNNNPTVFTPNNRPIVEFSMENRLALKAKEKRAQKAKEKNPNRKQEVKSEESADDTAEEEPEEEENKNVSKSKGKKAKKLKGKQEKVDSVNDEENNETSNIPEFAGLVGKKGVQTLPSFKPKGKITRNSLKQKKSKKQKLLDRKQREPKVPSKRPLEKIDRTEKIIAKHQKKLNSVKESKKKKKWYD